MGHRDKDVIELMQETIPDQLVRDLAEYRKNNQISYDDIDYESSIAVENFLSRIVEEFSREKEQLSLEEKSWVKEVLREDLFAQKKYNKRNVGEAQIKSKNIDNQNVEALKEIVQPNLYSAAVNYIKFVQPFEKDFAGDAFDPVRLEKELEIFREHQARYLIEDIGNEITPGNIDYALDALIALLPLEIKKISEQKNDKVREIDPKKVITKQKNIARKHIMDVLETNKNDGVIDWKSVELSIANDANRAGLSSQQCKKIIVAVHTIAKEQIEKIKTQPQNKKAQENITTKENTEKDFVFNDTTFVGTQARHLRELSQDAIAKRRMWIRKDQQMRASEKKLRSVGFDHDAVEDKEEIGKLKKEYTDAARSFFDNVAIYKKENGEKMTQTEMKEVVIDEGLRVYEDVTTSRAESFGEKMKNTLSHTKTWFKKISSRAKRAATVTFVVVGLVTVLSSTIGKDKVADVVDAYVAHGDHVRVEQSIDSGDSSGHVNADVLRSVVHRDFSQDSLGRELPTIDIDQFESLGTIADENHHSIEKSEKDPSENSVFERNAVEVEKDDTLWDIIKNQLQDNSSFVQLTDVQKDIAIDAIKDHFAKMDSRELRERGFHSGNIDKIFPGDHIDLSDVLDNADFVDRAIFRAQNS
jgi:hypothetical protein